MFLGSQRRYEEAAEEFRRGCAIGDKLACRNLWRYHLGTGATIADPEAVVRYFEACTPAEDLRMLGSCRRLKLFFRKAIALGDRASSFRLGLLLAQDASRAQEAEAAFRDAIGSGITPAHPALRNLLAQNAARWSEAEQIYWQGVNANDKGSFAGLMWLLARIPGATGRP